MSCSSKGIVFSPGSCFSAKEISSKNPGVASAFRRLSAGAVRRGAVEATSQGPAPSSCSESPSSLDGWQIRTLQSLEGAVAAIQAGTEAIEHLRQAFEEVSRENSVAAQVEARVLDSF